MKRILFTVIILVSLISANDSLNVGDSIGSGSKNNDKETVKPISQDSDSQAETDRHKEANRKCINGCDYKEWVPTIQFSVSGEGDAKFVPSKKFVAGETIYVKVGVAIKTDFWSATSKTMMPIEISFPDLNDDLVKISGSCEFVEKKCEGATSATKNANTLDFFSFVIINPTKGRKKIVLKFENDYLQEKYGQEYIIVVE
ncbi:MAG: hypothetical protein SPL21_07555 [Fibrobacter sp.]|nr:hypothetical protein [Fibrobacter sp.]